jgi:DNA repair protein RecN (Recombination protein N)
MLASLRVKDLVLIESLDLELHVGFNVLTGETGAGKSVLITAIGLALGERARAQLVRAGAPSAEVEALFEVRDEPSVRLRFAEAGWQVPDELLVRRVVSADGRSRCWVNGHAAPLSLVATLARGLAELSSQHEHHSLTDPATHLFSLDAFAGLDAARAEVTAAHGAVVAAMRDVEALVAAGVVRATRLEILRYQADQLARLEPKPGEEQELRGERDVLGSAARLIDAARGGEAELYGRDGAAVEVIAKVSDGLRRAASVDPALREVAAQLEEARVLVEDVADRLRRYADRFDADPRRLDEVEERLALYAKVRRTLGADADDLCERRARVEAELRTLDDHDALLAAAHEHARAALSRAGDVAARLSAQRKAAARKLAKAFARELADLGMGRAAIDVRVDPARGGEPQIDGAKLSETGIDRVEFLIAPNPGEPAAPLRSIASGGELSRAALALKRALAGVGPVGTYVFDEADAGISGAVADMVGRKLAEVARHHQVVCVTHLPQVAALADAHFRVAKAQAGNRTVTGIDLLDRAARIEEIAAMISGAMVTDRSRAAAAELLDARVSTRP